MENEDLHSRHGNAANLKVNYRSMSIRDPSVGLKGNSMHENVSRMGGTERLSTASETQRILRPLRVNNTSNTHSLSDTTRSNSRLLFNYDRKSGNTTSDGNSMRIPYSRTDPKSPNSHAVVRRSYSGDNDDDSSPTDRLLPSDPESKSLAAYNTPYPSSVVLMRHHSASETASVQRGSPRIAFPAKDALFPDAHGESYDGYVVRSPLGDLFENDAQSNQNEMHAYRLFGMASEAVSSHSVSLGRSLMARGALSDKLSGQDGRNWFQTKEESVTQFLLGYLSLLKDTGNANQEQLMRMFWEQHKGMLQREFIAALRGTAIHYALLEARDFLEQCRSRPHRYGKDVSAFRLVHKRFLPSQVQLSSEITPVALLSFLHAIAPSVMNTHRTPPLTTRSYIAPPPPVPNPYDFQRNQSEVLASHTTRLSREALVSSFVGAMSQDGRGVCTATEYTMNIAVKRNARMILASSAAADAMKEAFDDAIDPPPLLRISRPMGGSASALVDATPPSILRIHIQSLVFRDHPLFSPENWAASSLLALCNEYSRRMGSNRVNMLDAKLVALFDVGLPEDPQKMEEFFLHNTAITDYTLTPSEASMPASELLLLVSSIIEILSVRISEIEATANLIVTMCSRYHELQALRKRSQFASSPIRLQVQEVTVPGFPRYMRCIHRLPLLIQQLEKIGGEEVAGVVTLGMQLIQTIRNNWNAWGKGFGLGGVGSGVANRQEVLDLLTLSHHSVITPVTESFPGLREFIIHVTEDYPVAINPRTLPTLEQKRLRKIMDVEVRCILIINGMEVAKSAYVPLDPFRFTAAVNMLSLIKLHRRPKSLSIKVVQATSYFEKLIGGTLISEIILPIPGGTWSSQSDAAALTAQQQAPSTYGQYDFLSDIDPLDLGSLPFSVPLTKQAVVALEPIFGPFEFTSQFQMKGEAGYGLPFETESATLKGYTHYRHTSGAVETHISWEPTSDANANANASHDLFALKSKGAYPLALLPPVDVAPGTSASTSIKNALWSSVSAVLAPIQTLLSGPDTSEPIALRHGVVVSSASSSSFVDETVPLHPLPKVVPKHIVKSGITDPNDPRLLNRIRRKPLYGAKRSDRKKKQFRVAVLADHLQLAAQHDANKADVRSSALAKFGRVPWHRQNLIIGKHRNQLLRLRSQRPDIWTLSNSVPYVPFTENEIMSVPVFKNALKPSASTPTLETAIALMQKGLLSLFRVDKSSLVATKFAPVDLFANRKLLSLQKQALNRITEFLSKIKHLPIRKQRRILFRHIIRELPCPNIRIYLFSLRGLFAVFAARRKLRPRGIDLGNGYDLPSTGYGAGSGSVSAISRMLGYLPGQGPALQVPKIMVQLRGGRNVPVRVGPESDKVMCVAEIRFQGSAARSSVSSSTSPQWNEVLTLPVHVVGNPSEGMNLVLTSLANIQDHLVISLFDEVTEEKFLDDRDRMNTYVHRHRRYLGSIRIPFFNLLEQGGIEGELLLERPNVTLGYRRPKFIDFGPSSPSFAGGVHALSSDHMKATTPSEFHRYFDFSKGGPVGLVGSSVGHKHDAYLRVKISLDPPLYLKQKDVVDDSKDGKSGKGKGKDKKSRDPDEASSEGNLMTLMSRPPAKDIEERKFLERVARWGDKYSAGDRLVVPIVVNIKGESIFLCRYLSALPPPPDPAQAVWLAAKESWADSLTLSSTKVPGALEYDEEADGLFEEVDEEIVVPETCPRLNTLDACAHYVSLLPFLADFHALNTVDNADVSSIPDVWATGAEALHMGAGDGEEHAVLLACYSLWLDQNPKPEILPQRAGQGNALAAMQEAAQNAESSIQSRRGNPRLLTEPATTPLTTTGWKTYLTFGKHAQHGEGTWVVRLKHDFDSTLCYLIDPVSKKTYLASDNSCPVTHIGMLVSPTNVWANVQTSAIPSKMSFDLANKQHWVPLFNDQFEYPGPVKLPSVQTPIRYTLPNLRTTSAIESEIRQSLEEKIREWRPRYVTTIDANVSARMRNLLFELEARATGATGDVTLLDHRGFVHVDPETKLLYSSALPSVGYSGDPSSLPATEERLRALVNRSEFSAAENEDALGIPYLTKEHMEFLAPHVDISTAFGFPLHCSTLNLSAILNMVYSTGLHAIEDSDLQFGVSVAVIPYCSGLYSVWIYVMAFKSLRRFRR